MATAHVTAYDRGDGDLATWPGAVILSGRRSVVRTYRTDEHGETQAVVIRFGSAGRAIAGYSLGVGMLFRGELCYAHEDAERRAVAVAEHWLGVDAEDAERFAEELALAELDGLVPDAR